MGGRAKRGRSAVWSRAAQLLPPHNAQCPPLWEDFGRSYLFEVYDIWHNLSKCDFLVKLALKIPERIYPIAFETDCHEPRLLSRGDEDYDELDMMQCLLVRYGGGFSSADGFLAQLPLLSGVGEDFPEETDDLFYQTSVEQVRLAESHGSNARYLAS
ncbi:hypothetical protein C8R46DRAFT_283794 [Mycena filopes]|nr:hypothetical protein C8R46DRAFT_283794 [Mycena filopes]